MMPVTATARRWCSAMLLCRPEQSWHRTDGQLDNSRAQALQQALTCLRCRQVSLMPRPGHISQAIADCKVLLAAPHCRRLHARSYPRGVITPEEWPDGILQAHGAYTKASDTLALGHMLCERNVVSSSEGLAFLQQGWPPAPGRAVPIAWAFLKDPWMVCTYDTCTSAASNILQPVACIV